jgi:predicted site-specific integrase-resolvase
MRGESEGLLGDFMALVASFARKLYGMRSAANKRRLLEQAKEDL